MNIHVENLSFKTREETLRKVFEEFGEVASIKISIDSSTGQPKGQGMVTMLNEKEAERAVVTLNNQELDGMLIVVKKIGAGGAPRKGPRGGGGGIFG